MYRHETGSGFCFWFCTGATSPKRQRGPWMHSRPNRLDLELSTEFAPCPICGAFIETRDLAEVLAHVYDAEIETGEGPEPPRVDAHLDKIASSGFVGLSSG
jgi:hypothetical protein